MHRILCREWTEYFSSRRANSVIKRLELKTKPFPGESMIGKRHAEDLLTSDMSNTSAKSAAALLLQIMLM